MNKNQKDNEIRYVEETLIPQLVRKTAEAMTANPYQIIISNKTLKEKGEAKINDIFSRINLNELAYTLEQQLTLDGHAVVIFDRISDDEINLHVPTSTITRVDPATNELTYLFFIRYLYGGDFINIITETRTLKHISFDFYQVPEKDIENFLKAERPDNELTKNKKTWQQENNKVSKEQVEKDLGYELGNIQNIESNGFISAQYFMNIPSLDKKGLSDFLVQNHYTKMLNDIYNRIMWELRLNKSKFIRHNEIGANPLIASLQAQDGTNEGFVDDDFVIMDQNYSLVGGDSKQGYEYFETNNGNLQNLLTIFNYFLKKWFESSGQHQAGSDAGKQVSDLQAELERSSETSRTKIKIINRQFAWRLLIWKILRTLKDFKEIMRTDIIVKIMPLKIELEKTIIENEIMKMQSNLSSRKMSLDKVVQLETTTNTETLAETILIENTKDIETELQAKPIQVQPPTINNPQGKTNNQAKGFYNQKEEKGGK